MNIHEAYKIIRYYRDKEAECQCDPACGMCMPCADEHDGGREDGMWEAADQWLKAYEMTNISAYGRTRSGGKGYSRSRTEILTNP